MLADDDEAELLRDAAELRIALREAAIGAVVDQDWVRERIDEYQHEKLARDLAAGAFRSFPEFVLKFEKWYRQVSV
ncbi:hypothetical protein AXK58_00035 [Tsukamurella tyrosinosolvens]|nr:hypothetical protein AXK58_00035 [Tsukamurella tyrosinosolvens]